MEKMVHQVPMVDPAETDHPDKDRDKQLHPKHAKLAPTHQQGLQETPDLAARQVAQAHLDPHPMAEAVAHPAHQVRKDHPDSPVHPETRVNQVFPVKSTNSPEALDHPAQAVNPVRPETTVAMVHLVSQVAMVPRDRSATVAAQVATAKTAHPVDRARKENEVHQARATTAHLRVPHPDTSKPSVFVDKQHCQSQRIVDIAMVGCWDDIMLSQPSLLYYFRFAFLLLTVLAMSSSSEYQLG
jgi:hypothetical protein